MNVLVFSAHPDDAEFAMGGTLMSLAEQHDVVNVILTRGEAGTYGEPNTRVKEAERAGAVGGYRVRFLDFVDNEVADTPENVKKLAAVIREETPELVFATYHTNNGSHSDGLAHPDHTALGQLARKACRIAKFRNADVPGEAHLTHRIVYYMVPRYTKPSFVVDVGGVADKLQALWRAHASQTQLRGGAILDYLLAGRRAVGAGAGVGYAEAFIVEEPIAIEAAALLPEK